MSFKEVKLAEIRPSPLNPRKNFKGGKFDNLVDSIMVQGVLEPILLRPVDLKVDKKGWATVYEIVAGERRYRAAKKAAEQNGGIDGAVIPAIVRKLDDDQAFEIMTIENLQREDLTELEEAQGFKTYLDKKGIEALPSLAEKTSISPTYIRRRVKVLDLPKSVLKSWEKGKLVYGHLEQLMRLSDPKDINKLFKEVIDDQRWRPVTVKDLKSQIDNITPALNNAVFNLEKAGCNTCASNSTTQIKLWGIDSEKAVCLNQKCFKKQVNNHLLKNWKKTGIRKSCGTNGFRFTDDVSYEKRHDYYGVSKIPTACKSCDDFVTLIGIAGNIQTRQVCIGEKGCLDRSKKVAGNKEESTGPRVDWHGSYFRDKFYQQSIPEKIATIDPDDLKIDQLTLYHLLERESSVMVGIIIKFGLQEQFGVDPDQLTDDFYLYAPDENIWKFVSTLDRETVRKMTRDAALMHTLGSNNTETIRNLMAAHIGIDLATEFSMDDEYMAKKTKAELLVIGEKLKVFEDPKAQAFLFEKLLKKRGKFSACKKPELVKVFLESGVDLKGKVPDEILNMEAD